MYSITLNLQMLVPWLFRVPRVVFSMVITAIVIGVAVEAAKSFFVNLENFLGVIGYWSAAFIGIMLVEHLLFRRGSFVPYVKDEEAWDDVAKLPWGVAAISAGISCLGLVVPGMAQTWFTGPIGKKTGDIGFEVAFAVATLVYVPLRFAERKISGR
jgi:purine-cytosine permease-like protein